MSIDVKFKDGKLKVTGKEGEKVGTFSLDLKIENDEIKVLYNGKLKFGYTLSEKLNDDK